MKRGRGDDALELRCRRGLLAESRGGLAQCVKFKLHGRRPSRDSGEGKER